MNIDRRNMKKVFLTFMAMTVLILVFGARPEGEEKAKPVELTTEAFVGKVYDYEASPDKWVYKGDRPAIVDFYADWCGPCRITSRILKDLAGEYGDKIYIYKVNVDREPDLASAFGVQSIPMFLFIPMDEMPQLGAGALPKKSFREVIDKFLLKEDQMTEL